MSDLLRALDAIGGQDVVVVGDALLDEYIIGAEMKVCREGPAPAVRITERDQRPGGAANVAANCAALGGGVRFITVAGDDEDGDTLRHALRSGHVGDGDVISQGGRATVVKRRVVMDHHLLLRLDDGQAAPLSTQSEDAVIARLHDAFPTARAVIVSDYGYGTVTGRVVAAMAELQRRHGTVLVIDAHDIARFREVGATVVTPSFSELLPALGDADAEGPGHLDHEAPTESARSLRAAPGCTT